MDALGERLIRDRATSQEMRRQAATMLEQAKKLIKDAEEIDRLAELARHERP